MTHLKQEEQTPDTSPPRIGLALSGGGYRAAAFHLGTLNKLHQMGILPQVSVISTISGGSITGAYYCLHSGPFPAFKDEWYQGLQQKNVIRQILLSWMGFRMLLLFIAVLACISLLWSCHPWTFLPAIIALFWIVARWQFQLFPFSKRIEQIYDKFLYQKKSLDQLPETPILVIGATNLQTAKPFIFSKDRMRDSTYEFLDDPIRFDPKGFPVSRAVMASSCVPFAFTPVRIHTKYFLNPAQANDVHPALVDGGVYDNQGIHKVIQGGKYECNIVITSDAGAGGKDELTYRNTFALLLQTVEVFMSRIKKAQMVRNVYDNAATAKKQIAYLSLGWDANNCIDGFIKNLKKKQITAEVIQAHQLPAAWVQDPDTHYQSLMTYLQGRVNWNQLQLPTKDEKELARSVGTNLTALSKAKVDALMKQAEVLTEIQVRLYCPTIAPALSNVPPIPTPAPQPA